VIASALIGSSRREKIVRHLGRSDSAPALVLDVGWANGLGAIRSLARSGVRVLAIDHRPSALGLRSREALPVLCPDPNADEERFAAFLGELAELLPAPAPVFPTHDDWLAAVARTAGALDGKLLCPFPDWELLEPLQRKRFQLERAAEAGVAVPATR
jgi:D-aspartate ligase